MEQVKLTINQTRFVIHRLAGNNAENAKAMGKYKMILFYSLTRKFFVEYGIFFFLSAMIFSGCGGGGGNKNPVTTPTLTSIVIAMDTTTQLKALGYYSDGSTKDITTSVLWTSSDILVATVDASGKIIVGSKAGATYITASVGNLQSEGYPYTTSSGTVSPPSAPTGVTATAGDGTATISWSAVSGATSYNLYMASQTGVTKSNYITLADGMAHTGVTPPFVHAGLTNGKTYYFVVTAANAGGESAESQQVSATPKTVTKISAGNAHTCAILSGNILKCWGANQNGQIGDGTTTNSAIPVSVGISNVSNVDASSSGMHTCALLTDGSLKCWGWNDSGQLGNGTTTNSSIPVFVTGITNAISVSAGELHTCAVLSGGSVKCWGSNTSGQLGDGSSLSQGVTPSYIPVTVTGINSALSVSSGAVHTCALLSDGTVKCWGTENANGTTTPSSLPVSVSGMNNAIGISSGWSHSCALISDGSVRCWGLNAYGELGNNTTTSSATPVTVQGINSAISIAAGGNYTCAILSGGTVKCWGWNFQGQLGNGMSNGPETCVLSNSTTPCSKTPVSVSGMTSATSISTGDHTCVILSGGTVKCWGNNAGGSLGTGSYSGPETCTTNNFPCSTVPVSISNSLYAAPTVAQAWISMPNEIICLNKQTQLTAVYDDPFGGTQSFNWTASCGTITGTSSTVTYTAPSISPNGSCEIGVTITNSKNETATGNLGLIIYDVCP